MRLAWLAAALAVLLAACQPYGANEAETCHAAIPALERDGTVRVLETTADPAVPRTLHVTYELLDASGRRFGSARAVRCSFAGSALADAGRLAGLVGYEGPVSDIRLLFLNRFWLGDPETRRAALERVVTAEDGSGGIDPAVAYILQVGVASAPQATIYAVVGLAFGLVLTLTGQIHLAIGQTAMTGAYGGLLVALALAALLPEAAGPALALGALVGIVPAAALGALVAALCAALAGRGALAFMVATLGLAAVVDEALRIGVADRGQWIPNVLNQPRVLLDGDFAVVGTPVQAIVVFAGALALVGTIVVLPRLPFGRAFRAGADDPLMAALVGIDVGRLRTQTFVLSGALAGLAGGLYTLTYAGPDYAGSLLLGLKALFAAALGARSLAGPALGGAAIGLAEGYWAAYAGADGRDIAVLAVLAALLVLRTRRPD